MFSSLLQGGEFGAADRPHYRPDRPVAGEFVAWGESPFDKVMAAWSEAFRKFHPEAQFRWYLKGSGTSVGALFTGTANLALFGREIEANEIVTWRRMFPYDPMGFVVGTGSFDQFDQTVAPAILVNAQNPLAQISFTQLDAIYSHDRKRGASSNITTWGQLGLKGEWADRPITIYGLDPATGTAAYLRARVLQGGRWSYNARLPEDAPHNRYAGSGRDAAESLVRAIERDPGAIGIAGFQNLTAKLKALSVGELDAGPFVAGSAETVGARTYPLSRQVYIFIDQDPTRPWDSKIFEFLSFVLSPEGQEALAASGNYLPLPPKLAETERTRLFAAARPPAMPAGQAAPGK